MSAPSVTASPIAWRRRTVTNDGVRLAVFELGDESKPTVLLVHGWPDTHHLWTHVAPALADDYHVVAYDTRGYGDTDRPDEVESYRLPELAADLFAVADAVSPAAPVHVIAHDWGSVQAWEAMTQPPAGERIASFVSVSGPNLDHLGEWARHQLTHPTPRNLANGLSQVASSAYTVFFQLPVLPKLFFATVGSPRIWREFLHRVEGTPRAQVVTGPTLRRDMISGLRYYRANILPRLGNPDPRSTPVPVLELVNTRDIALRPAIYTNTHRYAKKLWRRDTPTGHWLPYTNPGHIVTNARAFIEQIESGTPGTPDIIGRTRLFAAPQALSGRLAVITGAGSGIGRETAYALAELGCELVLADINVDAADETAQQCKSIGVVASTYRLDVADTEAFIGFAETVRDTHGVPDIVVNNAGIAIAGPALSASDEQVDRLLGIDLRGVITGSREFGRQMVERGVGGHIVNVASAAAFTPSRDLGLYSSAKAGVLMFSESLRAELADHRIGVTAICPGIVDTNIVSTTAIAGLDAEDEAAQRDRLDRFYQKRGFTPDRVAADIVAALRANRAVVPVTPEAKIGYRIYRFAPWLSRAGARFKVAR